MRIGTVAFAQLVSTYFHQLFVQTPTPLSADVIYGLSLYSSSFAVSNISDRGGKGGDCGRGRGRINNDIRDSFLSLPRSPESRYSCLSGPRSQRGRERDVTDSQSHLQGKIHIAHGVVTLPSLLSKCEFVMLMQYTYIFAQLF